MKLKLKHIDNLRKGKKSGINIGSRAIGHHLYKYEEKKYELALKKHYLEITTKDRPNLIHLWDKVCQANDWKHIMLIKNMQEGTAKILISGIPIATGTLSDMKQMIKEYV